MLKRLGVAKECLALPHVERFLTEHPQETTHVLGYIYGVEGFDTTDDQLAAVIDSDQGRIYPHQAFQILRWAGGIGTLMPALLAVARRIAVDPSSDRFSKAAARKLVGALGDPADFELLLNEYETCGDALEKAQIICAVHRLERSRLNAFLGRVASDDELCARAAALVKAGAL